MLNMSEGDSRFYGFWISFSIQGDHAFSVEDFMNSCYMKNCCVSWRAVKGHLDMLLPEFSIWARVFHSEVRREEMSPYIEHG